MRRLLLAASAMTAACLVMAAGYAATGRPFVPLPKRPVRKAEFREAYHVRLNGVPMDLARFWSPEPPRQGLSVAPCPDPRDGTDAVLSHPDGAGGSISWRSHAELLPVGPSSRGHDPGGVHPPGSRRLLAAASDRPDGLSAGFYEASSERALERELAGEGWAALPFGKGLALWSRGAETLLVESPFLGRPGISLVYWRAVE